RATLREAELEQALDRERAELAEQQARWDEDSRRLRERLARHVGRGAEPAGVDSKARGADAGPANAADTGADPGDASTIVLAPPDPVLDSVLAQFGKLREQQAGRRAHTGKS
ncbi:MAG: hypothetical protein AAF790_15335, partial [Planctomycetota bacterium]